MEQEYGLQFRGKRTIYTKEFHHYKYLELDGYDEVELVERKNHPRKMGIHSSSRITTKIISHAHARLDKALFQPKEEIHGRFCILPI